MITIYYTTMKQVMGKVTIPPPSHFLQLFTYTMVNQDSDKHISSHEVISHLHTKEHLNRIQQDSFNIYSHLMQHHGSPHHCNHHKYGHKKPHPFPLTFLYEAWSRISSTVGRDEKSRHNSHRIVFISNCDRSAKQTSTSVSSWPLLFLKEKSGMNTGDTK